MIGGGVDQLYADRRPTDHRVCPHHPLNELTLWCVECRKYLCTKCLIEQREEHRTHELIEVKEMYDQVTVKLAENLEINEELTKRSQIKQAAVVTQMQELKTAADSIEARLFEFHRRMLAQVRSQYEERWAILRANYQEHQRQEQMLRYQEGFIRELGDAGTRQAAPIDFLSHWEAYEKIS